MTSFPVDLHVHSIGSCHAYSTIREIADAAARAGLQAVAITDHGPGTPDGPHPYYFSNLRRLRLMKHGCCVFSGVEEDLAGPEGEVYLPERILETLDVVLIGVHPHAWAKGQTPEAITRSLLRAMENPLIRGVAHPVNEWIPLGVREIVRQAAATGTAVELNASKIKGLEGQNQDFLEWVEEYDAPLMVNSDAHIADELGQWQAVETLLKGVTAARIINRSLAAAREFFKIRA